MITQPAAPAIPAPAAPRVPPAPRWAVWCAHLTTLVVLPSAVWRLLLVAGFPAGNTAESFASFETLGAKVWMLLLSVVSELVALLTVGLTRPWGDVVPRWIPLIGGRVVRPLAAVIPALAGAAILTVLWHDVPLWWTTPHTGEFTETGNIVVGILYQPLLLWGPLTAAVAISYYRRHRAAR